MDPFLVDVSIMLTHTFEDVGDLKLNKE